MDRPGLAGRFLLLWTLLILALGGAAFTQWQTQPRTSENVAAFSTLACGQVTPANQANRFIGRILLHQAQAGDALVEQDLGPAAALPEDAQIVSVRAALGLMHITAGDHLRLVPPGSGTPAPVPAVSPVPIGSAAPLGLKDVVVLRVGQASADGLTPLLIGVPPGSGNRAALDLLMASSGNPSVAVVAELTSAQATPVAQATPCPAFSPVPRPSPSPLPPVAA